ncbi:MAG: YdiU family protein, partial [Myxococcales bacterium]|nr:YdiU family protein [Myxococcales bacterium]
MQLTNGYLRLGPRFCSRERPVPVRAPELFLWNQTLADELGLGLDGERDRERIAAWLGGNETLFESEPVALVYAGHQFGSFVPRLGDGRAHVLGDCVDRGGTRRDLQLKGSGPTLFAR